VIWYADLLRKVSMFLKKYWIEILTFSIVFLVLLICLLPNFTWINTDYDGVSYTMAAKYMSPSHNTSAPLFLLLGRLFLFLPFGTEAWRMGLISVLATTICSILIYLTIKQHLLNNPQVRLYSIISSLIYGGSALVISQSIIIESYALSTMLMVAAYYMCIRGKFVLASIFLGLTLAIHPLLFLMIYLVIFIVYKPIRNKKLITYTLVFTLFYLYVPIVIKIHNDPSMWGNSTISVFLSHNLATLTMLTGTLSIYDFPKRVFDTIGILGISMGLGLIVMIWYFIKEKTYKNVLLWLTLIPIIYFATDLSAETYVYMLPSIAFGAVVIGIGLSKLKLRYSYAVLAVAVGLMVFNANYFDIGRTLDSNLSATEYYNEELPKLKDGDILLTGGWTGTIAYLYNKEEGRNIIPISTDIIPSDEYFKAKGINITRSISDNIIDRRYEDALSIANSNPNVWLAKETNPCTYEYELVPAEGNEWIFKRWLGYKVKTEWKWKPSNPYDFVTGALGISEWGFVLKSNKNMLMVGISGFGTVVLYLLATNKLSRKQLMDKLLKRKG